MGPGEKSNVNNVKLSLVSLPVYCKFEDCHLENPIFFDACLFLDHLKNDHKIIIHSLVQVAPVLSPYLDKYSSVDIAVLKDSFQTENGLVLLGKPRYPLDRNEATGPDDENDSKYLASGDSNFRLALGMAKLDHLLSVQSVERQEAKKETRPCFLCTSYTSHDRNDLFSHLSSGHRLRIGNPDNLVYVPEYLDKLASLVKNRICIFCEGVFENHQTLKKHMRSKDHYRINPFNPTYDKHYIVNYQKCVSTSASEDADDDGGWKDGWTDWSDNEPEPVMCLFDECVFDDAEDLIENHLKKVHHFDLSEIARRLSLDFYSLIQLINYIRSKTMRHVCYSCNDCFSTFDALTEHYIKTHHTSSIPDRSLWDSLLYLLPVHKEDPLLRALEHYACGNPRVGDY